MTDKELMEEMELRVDCNEGNLQYEQAFVDICWELDGMYMDGWNEFDVMEEANRILIGE